MSRKFWDYEELKKQLKSDGGIAIIWQLVFWAEHNAQRGDYARASYQTNLIIRIIKGYDCLSDWGQELTKDLGDEGYMHDPLLKGLYDYETFLTLPDFGIAKDGIKKFALEFEEVLKC